MRSVASSLLRKVECAIGRIHQTLGCSLVGTRNDGGNSEADRGNPVSPSCMLEAQLTDAKPHSLGNGGSPLAIRVRQQNGEFLTAVARHNVRQPGSAGDNARHRAEAPVAGGVPILIIIRLN
jgi:hypothetical protein